MERSLAEVLAKLYAPGFGLAAPRSWPSVVRALRRAGPGAPAGSTLAEAGLSYEALLLDHSISDERVPPLSGVGVDLITAIDDEAAAVWPLVGRIARGAATGAASSAVEISLDAPLLPPAFWSRGQLPLRRAPTLAGIGSRAPSRASLVLAREVGVRLARAGGHLVSGGADGCDSAFATGHAAATVLLPHGIDRPRDLPGTNARLSVFAPDAEFSRERAMRRNALIVASADLTLVAHARLREGGSWHAALGALRRRAPVGVYVGPGEGPGAHALVALGALPVRDADEALAALELVGGLSPHDDPALRWAVLRGTRDERHQPPLLLT